MNRKLVWRILRALVGIAFYVMQLFGLYQNRVRYG